MTRIVVDYDHLAAGTTLSAGNTDYDAVVIAPGNTFEASDVGITGARGCKLYSASGDCYGSVNIAGDYISASVKQFIDADFSATSEHLQFFAGGLVTQLQYRPGRQFRITTGAQVTSPSNAVPLNSEFRVDFDVNESGSAKPGWNPNTQEWSETYLADGQCQLRVFYDPDAARDSAPDVVLDNTNIERGSPFDEVIYGQVGGTGTAVNIYGGPLTLDTVDLAGPNPPPPGPSISSYAADPNPHPAGSATDLTVVAAPGTPGNTLEYVHEVIDGLPPASLTGETTDVATLTGSYNP